MFLFCHHQEDPDETLRRKTLDLLFRITNTANVSVIVDKLLKYLRQTTDSYLRTELVSRMTQLAERCDFYHVAHTHTRRVWFELLRRWWFMGCVS